MKATESSFDPNSVNNSCSNTSMLTLFCQEKYEEAFTDTSTGGWRISQPCWANWGRPPWRCRWPSGCSPLTTTPAPVWPGCVLPPRSESEGLRPCMCSCSHCFWNLLFTNGDCGATFFQNLRGKLFFTKFHFYLFFCNMKPYASSISTAWRLWCF